MKLMHREVLKCLEILIGFQQQMLALMTAEVQKNSPFEDELLDSTDTKKLLKISDSSLYRLRKNKQLYCKQISGKWYFYKSSILALPTKDFK